MVNKAGNKVFFRPLNKENIDSRNWVLTIAVSNVLLDG